MINSTKKKEALILGNSFAGAQFNGIVNALKRLNYTKVYHISRNACIPFGGLLNQDWHAQWKCLQWDIKVFDGLLNAIKPDTLILSAR